MNQELSDLIEVSRYYGKKRDFVIAGGGNTSYKSDSKIYVKASGIRLADIDENGFAILDRKKLNEISKKRYSDDVLLRESQVKDDLFRSSLFPEKRIRPSVEASFHDLINYTYVVHTHPSLVNALMCSNSAEKNTKDLFGNEAVFVRYTDPGYVLFKAVEREIFEYRKKFQKDPKLIFLENHGIFVSADSIEEIKALYNEVISKIEAHILHKLQIEELPVDQKIVKILPAIRVLLSTEKGKIAKIKNNTLVSNFSKDQESFNKISFPFTPDNIVYCKAYPLYIDCDGSPEEILSVFQNELSIFLEKHNYPPKIIIVKNLGIIGVEDNLKSVNIILDVFHDIMEISHYSQYFGGPKFLTKSEIDFIDNWEVENYRREISKESSSAGGKLKNRIAIVTGAAQGFGKGIAEHLASVGMNVVVADRNEQAGVKTIEEINSKTKNNRAIFANVDVSNPESVQQMIFATVKEFGGIDLVISNAGVLRAGGLADMDEASFDFVTNVNYKGYFVCTKYCSEVMKLQHQYKKNYFTDIIQINSKSGLQGSNKNFAYAGGKFGGIGLTQSFALELVDYNIKVNAICPGNFFEGPLWSDPENGLFAQYLRAGKVAGAKSIEDVKKFYEDKVPMRRGCTPEDVVKAIYYVIEQDYETGQAIPVTGGQVMLA